MSTADPYPYIYVNPDGTARELHANERKYLETPFKLGDGNTPYIKIDYDARDGWGEIRGYLERSKASPRYSDPACAGGRSDPADGQ